MASKMPPNEIFEAKLGLKMPLKFNGIFLQMPPLVFDVFAFALGGWASLRGLAWPAKQAHLLAPGF